MDCNQILWRVTVTFRGYSGGSKSQCTYLKCKFHSDHQLLQDNFEQHTAIINDVTPINPVGCIQDIYNKTSLSVINNGLNVHVFVISLVQHLELTSSILLGSQPIAADEPIHLFIIPTPNLPWCSVLMSPSVSPLVPTIFESKRVFELKMCSQVNWGDTISLDWTPIKMDYKWLLTAKKARNATEFWQETGYTGNWMEKHQIWDTALLLGQFNL